MNFSGIFMSGTVPSPPMDLPGRLSKTEAPSIPPRTSIAAGTSIERSFGNLSRDFWFGNEFTHKILYRDDHELRVELGYNQGEEFPDWAEYSLFRLDSEGYSYQLAVDGVFRGSLPDALEPHIHLDFSTYDRRSNAQSAGGNSSCAEHYGGGWWLDRCTRSNLNGEHGNQRAGPAILWSNWGIGTDIPRTSRMMIRPVNFDSGGSPANSYED